MPTAVALVVVARLMAAAATGGRVTLYYRGDLVVKDNATYYKKKYRTFSTGPAQRCYSFPCFDAAVSWVQWSDVQLEATVVLYADDCCRGEAYSKVSAAGHLYVSELDSNASIRSVADGLEVGLVRHARARGRL